MPDRVELNAGALRRMYVDERMTTAGIAGQLGCGATTVSRRLRTLGIPPRSRGPRREREGDAEATRRWSPQIAWVVGLIATDGNLARAGHRQSHRVVNGRPRRRNLPATMARSRIP